MARRKRPEEFLDRDVSKTPAFALGAGREAMLETRTRVYGGSSADPSESGFCGFPRRLETFMPSDAIQCKPLEVVVSDRGIERAIKMLKRKLASEGVLRELKMRRHYMKPSVKRRKKQAEAARRRRKRAKMDAAPPK